MTGLAETLQKTPQTLEERGVPSDSWFRATFADGSVATEHDVNWSSISDKVSVSYFGNQKLVYLCRHPLTRIEAYHEGLYAAVDVPEGARAYQSIRGETLIIPNFQRSDKVVGRVIGYVLDGEVKEERFLNGLAFKVEGLRK